MNQRLAAVATAFGFGIAAISVAAIAQADTIQLVNGDTLNGKVVSMSDTELKLKSDVLGEISLPRAKVIAITFGDRKPLPTAPAPVQAPAGTTEKPLKAFGVTTDQLNKALPKLGINPQTPGGQAPAAPQADSPRSRGPSPSDTPEDVVRRLREEGLDAGTMKGLQKQIPLLNVPGVKGFFDEKVSGLMSGRIDISDIRKDAIKARDGLLDLKKDLGPNGAALDGYLRILDGFIDETKPRQQPAKPKGKAPQTAGDEGRGKT